MTNEEKLSTALKDFKKMYPNVTSVDIQTFIIGWQEATKNCFMPDFSNSNIDLLIEERKQWYLNNEYLEFGEELPQFIQLKLDTDLRRDMNVLMWLFSR